MMWLKSKRGFSTFNGTISYYKNFRSPVGRRRCLSTKYTIARFTDPYYGIFMERNLRFYTVPGMSRSDECSVFIEQRDITFKRNGSRGKSLEKKCTRFWFFFDFSIFFSIFFFDFSIYFRFFMFFFDFSIFLIFVFDFLLIFFSRFLDFWIFFRFFSIFFDFFFRFFDFLFDFSF